MSWMDFAIRLLVGFFLGVGIGIERQWLRRRAILKTNVLVTLGSAMFVMLSIMTPGDASPTRISAQIVSGVGFLGGGVILREGASVRGTNTAATLWCAAAIGTLVGAGHLVQAYFGTFAVVSANLLLRPLVEAFRQPEESINDANDDSSYWDERSETETLPSTDNDSIVSEELSDSQDANYSRLPLVNSLGRKTHYICYVTCSVEREKKVLTKLFQSAQKLEWQLVQLDSKESPSDRQNPSEEIVEIKADFCCDDGYFDPEQIEEVVAYLKSDSSVSSVIWQFVIE